MESNTCFPLRRLGAVGVAKLRFRQSHRRWLLLAVVAVCIASSLGASTDQQKRQSQTAAQASAPAGRPPGAEYVGTDTCKTCHEDLFTKGFQATPHSNLLKLAGKHGCEDCHGPGSAHVEGGGDITKVISFKHLAASQSSQRCLECHEYGEEHGNFSRSMHLRNDVGCTSCHSVHEAKFKPSLLRASQPNLCYRCHQEVRADFSKPFRHRINEGLLECTDCHNVHGGFLTRQLRATAAQDTVCFRCHTDKAGPFRLRTCAGQDRGLHLLSHAARIGKPSAAEACSGECALLGVPHLDRGLGGSWHSFVPQPGAEVSGMHDVPRQYSRLKLQ